MSRSNLYVFNAPARCEIHGNKLCLSPGQHGSRKCGSRGATSLKTSAPFQAQGVHAVGPRPQRGLQHPRRSLAIRRRRRRRDSIASVSRCVDVLRISLHRRSPPRDHESGTQARRVYRAQTPKSKLFGFCLGCKPYDAFLLACCYGGWCCRVSRGRIFVGPTGVVRWRACVVLPVVQRGANTAVRLSLPA